MRDGIVISTGRRGLCYVLRQQADQDKWTAYVDTGSTLGQQPITVHPLSLSEAFNMVAVHYLGSNKTLDSLEKLLGMPIGGPNGQR